MFIFFQLFILCSNCDESKKAANHSNYSSTVGYAAPATNMSLIRPYNQFRSLLNTYCDLYNKSISNERIFQLNPQYRESNVLEDQFFELPYLSNFKYKSSYRFCMPDGIFTEKEIEEYFSMFEIVYLKLNSSDDVKKEIDDYCETLINYNGNNRMFFTPNSISLASYLEEEKNLIEFKTIFEKALKNGLLEYLEVKFLLFKDTYKLEAIKKSVIEDYKEELYKKKEELYKKIQNFKNIGDRRSQIKLTNYPAQCYIRRNIIPELQKNYSKFREYFNQQIKENPSEALDSLLPFFASNIKEENSNFNSDFFNKELDINFNFMNCDFLTQKNDFSKLNNSNCKIFLKNYQSYLESFGQYIQNKENFKKQLLTIEEAILNIKDYTVFEKAFELFLSFIDYGFIQYEISEILTLETTQLEIILKEESLDFLKFELILQESEERIEFACSFFNLEYFWLENLKELILLKNHMKNLNKKLFQFKAKNNNAREFHDIDKMFSEMNFFMETVNRYLKNREILDKKKEKNLYSQDIKFTLLALQESSERTEIKDLLDNQYSWLTKELETLQLMRKQLNENYCKINNPQESLKLKNKLINENLEILSTIDDLMKELQNDLNSPKFDKILKLVPASVAQEDRAQDS